MKTKSSLLLTFGISILALASCATANYGKDIQNMSVVKSGRVIQNSKKAKPVESDILFDGNGTNAQLKNSVEVSVPFVAGTRINPLNHTHEFKWSGSASLDGWAGDIDISYTWDNDTDGNVAEIRDVNISGPDAARYNFLPFSLAGDNMFATNRISHKSMPHNLAQVVIDGKYYVLQAQCMKWDNASECVLFTMKNQIFRIVDENGAVCAEFDDSFYRIFENENATPEQLIPCVAAYSVLYATRVRDKGFWSVTL